MTHGPDPGPPHRVVVVGHGMAGARLVEELLGRGGHASGRPLHLSVVGTEPYGGYNRVLLSEVVAGRADVAGLAMSDPAGLAAGGVDVRLGTSALAVDRAARVVRLDDGTHVPYDSCVLATGASPIVPPLRGVDPAAPPTGVHTLRDLDDARAIVAAAANTRRAVVLGGGLLGLEAARGLASRGLDVVVLHAAPHVMERQLDAAGGAVLARRLGRLGVRVRTGALTVAATSRAGRLTGLELDDGSVVPADLLVVAIGARPRTGLAERAGLAVGRGVLVDDTLTTSDPDILAIGDCAEHRGECSGLVAPAWEQARVVADRLTGTDPDAAYTGHRPVTRLKAADLDVAALGTALVDPWEAEDAGLEVVQLLDAARGRYVKAVLRDGVVVGAISIGEPRAAAELTLLAERGSPAPRDRAVLLLPGLRAATDVSDAPTLIPDRATVCRCNGVTKGSIVAAWTAGARTVEDVTAATRAATGCGTCRATVDGILCWLTDADPEPAPDGAGIPAPTPAAGTDPAATIPARAAAVIEGAAR
ncbi:MAG: NAD(P)/FAD-dependent oxidoreductase [Actinobacteria bacterium]|nr:NAD(P)/FAD-dependent oxidoreductase [Actinomycetota bacterium]